jgi:hypothetical protein
MDILEHRHSVYNHEEHGGSNDRDNEGNEASETTTSTSRSSSSVDEQFKSQVSNMYI